MTIWPPAEPLEPGVGFPVLHLGTSRGEVVALLGEWTGEHGDGRILTWLNRGVMVRLDGDDRVENLTLGAVFVKDGVVWPEVALPQGVSWETPMPDVRDILGEPLDFAAGEVVPGSGRKHHVVQWPGMKMTFDEHGHLTSVSVP
jgi:hypothetical protein